MLRHVNYTDNDGFNWRVALPAGVPDSEADKGVVIGPPNLGKLGLPFEVQKRLHNELHARELWTIDEVRNRQHELFAALQRAYRLDSVALMNAYQNKD